MNFLFEFSKPSTWLSSVDDGIMGAITTGLRTLMFWLDTFIYNLIIDLYSFFNKLCTARLLDDTVLNAISQRVGLILGLIMFFSVVFSFIQMLINPEKMSDKEMGAVAIIKKVLIVIVMLGASNFAFQSFYKVQSLVIKENVISKLILPYQVSDEDMDNFGNILVKELMGAFYQIDTFDNVEIKDSNEANKRDNCTTMRFFFLEQVEKNGNFDLGYTCLNESIQVSVASSSTSATGYQDEIYMINFNGIMSVIAGIIIAYVLFMYCFGVGIRMVQLAFLEIISPMAIVSYLSPKKDNMFNKWWKIYFSTYIDVFLRIAIINFVVFLIMTLFAANSSGQFVFWESLGNPTGLGERSFFMVVIIIALLTFAKKAPELLKELFPAGASKLGLGVSMKDFVGLQKGFKIGSGILGGAVGGAAIGLIGGAGIGGKFGGFAGGLLKGGLSGLKGQGLTKTATGAWKNQAKANLSYANAKANGATWFGYQMAHLQQGLNIRTDADRFNTEKANLEAENAVYKSYDSKIDAAEKRAEGQIQKGAFRGNIHADTTLRLQKMAEVYTQQAANLDKNDFFDKSKYRDDLVILAASKGISEENYRYAKDYERALSDFENSTANTLNRNDYIDVDAYEKKREEYVSLADNASAEALVEMKKAKKDYITEQLRIAREEGAENADAPTIQALQEAAGILEAYADNTDYDFTYETKDEQGNVIEKGRLTGDGLLAGDYDKLDSANNHMKAKQTENNKALSKNQTEGAAARANAGK